MHSNHEGHLEDQNPKFMLIQWIHHIIYVYDTTLHATEIDVTCQWHNINMLIFHFLIFNNRERVIVVWLSLDIEIAWILGKMGSQSHFFAFRRGSILI